MNRLSLIAKITPKPEYLTEARKALEEIIPATLEEPGCHVFRLHEDDDGRLYLYEEFEDEVALKTHLAKPYAKAVFVQYDEWLARPLEVTKLRRLA